MIPLMSSIIHGLLNAGTTAGVIILKTAFLLIDAANTPKNMNSELETQCILTLDQILNFKGPIKAIVNTTWANYFFKM